MFLTGFRFRRDGNMRITGVLKVLGPPCTRNSFVNKRYCDSINVQLVVYARSRILTIGHLKRCFHFLHTQLKVLPECGYTTVVACCVMPNIAQDYSCVDGNCDLPPKVLVPPSPPEADNRVAQWRAILRQHCCGKPACWLPSLQAVCWAYKLVVDKRVRVSVGLVVLVALATTAVLPQAGEAPHPRPAASPKANNLSLPGLRHLEQNDPGGHKDVAEGSTFWANHISALQFPVPKSLPSRDATVLVSGSSDHRVGSPRHRQAAEQASSPCSLHIVSETVI
ncbi:hypothetical protein HPB47_008907 [Ixodes persulcatus]|uniref:Uncharacterized protein n=1 Tax=Ixodes persulcatus TaxID=34615 RepID=A0AC60P3E8_IXOPE|nr:hypothetical protein HPB47_008907 [Ixodes persulcatus]